MPLQDVDNSDQKTYSAGWAYSAFGRLGYRVHSEPTRHESPFLSVHRARTIRGRLGQGCYIGTRKAAAHLPSTAGKNNGARK